MDIKDINAIIAEISNLKNLGIVLSKDLDCDRMTSEYENIEYQSSKGHYVLPKMYSLIKRIQYPKCIRWLKEFKSPSMQVYITMILMIFKTLFSTVEAIRQKLGEEYQKRTEIISKVRDLRKILNEEETV